MKLPAWNPWELICRCWPWTAGTGPPAHEEQGHQEDEELFVDVPSVFGGSDLIHEELGIEEHASGQQNQSDGGRQLGSLGWYICSWLRGPFCPVLGNLLLHQKKASVFLYHSRSWHFWRLLASYFVESLSIWICLMFSHEYRRSDVLPYLLHHTRRYLMPICFGWGLRSPSILCGCLLVAFVMWIHVCPIACPTWTPMGRLTTCQCHNSWPSSVVVIMETSISILISFSP